MTNHVPSFPKFPIMLGTAVTMLLLAACNRAPSSAAEQATDANNSQAASVALPDPCKLVTAADIQSVTGGTVKQDANSSTSLWCHWNLSAGAMDHEVVVSVHPWTGAPGGPSASVNGVGDKAFWLDPINELDVLKGGVDIGVRMVGYGSQSKEPYKEQAIALAKIAVSRFR